MMAAAGNEFGSVEFAKKTGDLERSWGVSCGRQKRKGQAQACPFELGEQLEVELCEQLHSACVVQEDFSGLTEECVINLLEVNVGGRVRG